MRDWDSYRKRFLQDSVPIRLGGVAANLARINSASDHEGHRDLVRNMFEDSQYLIEWAAPETVLETQVQLIDLQLQLAIWKLKWDSIWNDGQLRRNVAESAGQWSNRSLDLSGLLNEEETDTIPRPS